MAAQSKPTLLSLPSEIRREILLLVLLPPDGWDDDRCTYKPNIQPVPKSVVRAHDRSIPLLTTWGRRTLLSGAKTDPKVLCDKISQGHNWQPHFCIPKSATIEKWGTEEMTRIFRVCRQLSRDVEEALYSSFAFAFGGCRLHLIRIANEDPNLGSRSSIAAWGIKNRKHGGFPELTIGAFVQKLRHIEVASEISLIYWMERTKDGQWMRIDPSVHRDKAWSRAREFFTGLCSIVCVYQIKVAEDFYDDACRQLGGYPDVKICDDRLKRAVDDVMINIAAWKDVPYLDVRFNHYDVWPGSDSICDDFLKICTERIEAGNWGE
ncbi:MAG: hypothetical protein M1820_010581 [Bogoriella megaspora]|nr:MAG: hypothetical protein M1820_010581 [Bogoriella megaspora]